MFIKKLRSFNPLVIIWPKGCFLCRNERITQIEKWIKEGRGIGIGVQ